MTEPAAKSAVGERYCFVDALRGLAAMMVVLFHASGAGHIDRLLEILPLWVRSALESGKLGVAIFFVISGFVIAHSLSKNEAGWSRTTKFLLRRSLRLDPAYWAAIAFTIGLAFLSSHFAARRSLPEVSLEQLLAHVFYLQDILSYPPLSPIFWTLCYEVQFYIAYSILLLVGAYGPTNAMRSLRSRVVLIGGFMISLPWAIGIAPILWPGLFINLFYGFLLGVGAYWAWRDSSLRGWYLGYNVILAVATYINQDAFQSVCLVTSNLILLMAVSGRIRWGASWRIVQFLGLISYSLYLFHNPVTGAVFAVGYGLTGRSSMLEAFWFSVVIASCVVFAWLMWWTIERPSVELSKRI